MQPGTFKELKRLIGSVKISSYFRKTFPNFAGKCALTQMIGYSSNDIA